MNINLKNHVDYLSGYLKEKEPLAALFNTEEVGYIYDTGTSKVLQCDDMEFTILQKLFNRELESSISTMIDNFGEERVLEGLVNIKNTIESEKILQSEKTAKFYAPSHFEAFENQVNNEVRQISLELTEQCNLRCEYCIYNDEFEGKRNHGVKEMTEEVAQLAIDYLAKHGSKEGVAVTFYGGEPLIKFPLIKKCIEYSKQVITDRKIGYSLTSNLVLMTSEIASYLASVDGLSIVCSIDGPKHIHDNFRKDVNGNGTFDRAIRGLQYLIEAFGDSSKDRVLINMVYTPPYYPGRAKEISDFFNSLEWLPKEIEKFSSYPETGSIPLELIKEKYKEKGIDFDTNHNEKELKNWSETNYLDYVRSNKNNKERDQYFTKSTVEKTLLKIHKRPIYNEANGRYPLNGCCVPAARKIYICTDGKLMLCEKISGAPSIGDVYSGLDIDKVKDIFIKEYASKTEDKCTKCWAVRLCHMCYAQCYTDGKIDLDKRDRKCGVIRKQIAESLKLYHRCMEINPEGLMYINDIEVI